MIALTYGPEVDWYKNICAAGKCRILRHKQWFEISAIEPIDAQEALTSFPGFERAILSRVGIQDFVRLR